MRIAQFAKSSIFEIMRGRYFNFFLRKAVPLVSDRYLRKLPFTIPIRGRFPVNIEGVRFFVESDGKDPIASRTFCYHGAWSEDETFRLLKGLIPHFQSFFDIGANTGMFSLFVAQSSSAIKVTAFEPVSEIYRYLKRNIETNRFNNARVENLALGRTNEVLEIHIPETTSLSSSSTFVFRKGYRPEKCKVVKLDDYLIDHPVHGQSLLKIDTERTEHFVLEGGIEFIRANKPWMICEILDDSTGLKVHKVLQGLGYRYFSILENDLKEEAIPVGDDVSTFNYLFVPSEQVARLLEWKIPLKIRLS